MVDLGESQILQAIVALYIFGRDATEDNGGTAHVALDLTLQRFCRGDRVVASAAHAAVASL